jgi:YidC/Oxa1 family membrane protein insertase
MEKRALMAFVLSMAVFMIWAYLFSDQPAQNTSEKEKRSETGSTGQAVTSEAGRVSGLAPIKETTEPIKTDETDDVIFRDITVRTDLYTAVFTEKGGRLKSLTLNRYRSTADVKSPPLELVIVESESDYPFGLSFRAGDSEALRNAYFKSEKYDMTIGESRTSDVLNMSYQGPGGIEIVRQYAFKQGSYLIDMSVTLKNRSEKRYEDNLVIGLDSLPLSDKETYAGFGAWIDNKLYEIKPKKVEGDLEELHGKTYKISWAGYEDQYFMATLLPEEQEKTRIKAQQYGKNGVRIQFTNAPFIMDPQTQIEYRYKIFYGPKDYKLLKDIGHDLQQAIDFGWFDILSKPLLILMTWLYGFVGNYGIVIILITVMIKALFWPLTAKSYKSMKNMQKLQPKIMKLRDKYKDDRQKMNAEMMQLYRTYKVNPLGGCLPMVIQIPVFIALYRLLDYSLELRHAPFWLWIQDLSTPDRLFHFNVTIPLMQPPAGIPVLTLLMGATMFLQQKMTPVPGDPIQAKMMMLMPVFFTFIFINFPAGLVLYWLTNNILSIGQQTLINKRAD